MPKTPSVSAVTPRRDPARIAEVDREISLILSRLVPGMGVRSTTNDRVRHAVELAIGDLRPFMTGLQAAARDKDERPDTPSPDAEPVTLTREMIDAVLACLTRLDHLRAGLAVDDPDASGDRIAGYTERGDLDHIRRLGSIPLKEWPNSTRSIEIDEFNGHPFAHDALDCLQREPNRIQRRRIATSLHKLIDLLALPPSGPLPDHAADAPRDPDPHTLKAVHGDLRPVIAAAKKNNTLPDRIRRLPHVDHDTDAAELTYRLIAARLGYAPATGWRTVKAAIGGYSR